MPILSMSLMASVWTRSKWIYIGRFEETHNRHPCFDFYEKKIITKAFVNTWSWRQPSPTMVLCEKQYGVDSNKGSNKNSVRRGSLEPRYQRIKPGKNRPCHCFRSSHQRTKRTVVTALQSQCQRDYSTRDHNKILRRYEVESRIKAGGPQNAWTIRGSLIYTTSIYPSTCCLRRQDRSRENIHDENNGLGNLD